MIKVRNTFSHSCQGVVTIRGIIESVQKRKDVQSKRKVAE